MSGGARGSRVLPLEQTASGKRGQKRPTWKSLSKFWERLGVGMKRKIRVRVVRSSGGRRVFPRVVGTVAACAGPERWGWAQAAVAGGGAGALQERGGGWHHLLCQDGLSEDPCPRSSSPWPTCVTRLPSTTASCPEGDSATSGREGVHSGDRVWQGGPGSWPEMGRCRFQKTCHARQILPRPWFCQNRAVRGATASAPWPKPAALNGRVTSRP